MKFLTFLQEEGVWCAAMEALNGLAAPPEGPCPVMPEIKNKETDSFRENLQFYSHTFSLPLSFPVEV